MLKRCWRVGIMWRAIAIRIVTRVWHLTRCLRSRGRQNAWSLSRRSPKAIFSLPFGWYYLVDLIGGIVKCGGAVTGRAIEKALMILELRRVDGRGRLQECH